MGYGDYGDSMDYYFRRLTEPQTVEPPAHNGGILFISGLILFSTGFYLMAVLFRWLLPPKYSRAVVLEVANKTMSAVQATTASICGALVVRHCWDDMMRCRHHLITSYLYFVLGYGFYDSYCMFYVQWAKLKERRLDHDCGWRDGLRDFFNERPLIIFHHVFLAIFAFPALVWFRKGGMDFIMGCCFLCELSTPFVSFRAILILLDMKHSTRFLLNGALMVVTFLFCRILSFPFMFWSYARYAKVRILDVPWMIPRKCTCFCCIIIAMQLYWLGLMLKGIAKVLRAAPLTGDAGAPGAKNQHLTSSRTVDENGAGGYVVKTASVNVVEADGAIGTYVENTTGVGSTISEYSNGQEDSHQGSYYFDTHEGLHNRSNGAERARISVDHDDDDDDLTNMS